MRPEPFEKVVATHGPAVLRVCRAMVGAVDADDAWSETFLSAMRAYPDLGADSNVAAWLTRIAHNKCIDLLRRARRTPAPTEDLDEEAVLDLRLEPTDEALGTALAALTPRQRAAVTYHHVVGLTYAEVGEILGSSEAAARRSAADGIAKLRSTCSTDAVQEGADR